MDRKRLQATINQQLKLSNRTDSLQQVKLLYKNKYHNNKYISDQRQIRINLNNNKQNLTVFSAPKIIYKSDSHQKFDSYLRQKSTDVIQLKSKKCHKSCKKLPQKKQQSSLIIPKTEKSLYPIQYYPPSNIQGNTPYPNGFCTFGIRSDNIIVHGNIPSGNSVKTQSLNLSNARSVRTENYYQSPFFGQNKIKQIDNERMGHQSSILKKLQLLQQPICKMTQQIKNIRERLESNKAIYGEYDTRNDKTEKKKPVFQNSPRLTQNQYIQESFSIQQKKDMPLSIRDRQNSQTFDYRRNLFLYKSSESSVSQFFRQGDQRRFLNLNPEISFMTPAKKSLRQQNNNIGKIRKHSKGSSRQFKECFNENNDKKTYSGSNVPKFY